ncbi:HlyD family type I secretion periplasmic adaptor subunit [Glycocaulis albus]|uniref:Membrane fusion protein (MFP) family protein n=1 Tax=Glycocaulis albus TaxID=1382801 RepID=A0ABQ1XX22_9PROT|nr:HlyD family type I secretion periplasmic adaptor subunit [Glycocaulis albus]GGH05253.1 HlyD family type I secretion periplasmic adaptor subunit [Glycocaulis albus]
MSRHLAVLIEAWKRESERRRQNRRKRIETQFLPAALEIMDTPPRPLGRIVLWTIIATAIAALLWASLSRVDVVAVAEGRLTPVGRLQSVETLEAGTVRAIHVREGQQVRAGEALVELDTTFTEADVSAARSELETARLQRRRALALLAWADEGEIDWSEEASLSPAIQTAEARLVRARIREHQTRLASMVQRREGALAARDESRASLSGIEITLPLIRRQYENHAALAEEGFAPHQRVDELEERLNSLRASAAGAREAIRRATAEAAMIEQDMETALESFTAQAAAELSEAESIIASRTEILAKAEARSALQTLAAPVDGTVNAIAVTTIGEVAQPGEPVITLVPAGGELYVEAFLLNRDVGFVAVGQEVRIKLEAFPFMRYGYLDGIVEQISPDAIVDQHRGLVYPARVRISANNLRVNGEMPVLAAGMAATAEIRTGRRRVIAFLLSPVMRTMSEAGRER